MRFIKFGSSSQHINAEKIVSIYLAVRLGKMHAVIVHLDSESYEEECFDTLEAAQARLDELLAILNQDLPNHAPHAQFYYPAPTESVF